MGIEDLGSGLVMQWEGYGDYIAAVCTKGDYSICSTKQLCRVLTAKTEQLRIYAKAQCNYR